MEQSLIRNLKARDFLVHCADTPADAKEMILSIIGNQSVGIGGSKSVQQLGLYDALTEKGNAVHWHWKADTAHKQQERNLAIGSEVYLCSANALLKDGRIVEIDGTGNRVAGILYGPPVVILVIGSQKICADLDHAIKRIKQDACPENARRLGLSTPCAATGTCADCRSSARMCNATVILEWPMRIHREFHIVLVDEPLGL